MGEEAVAEDKPGCWWKWGQLAPDAQDMPADELEAILVSMMIAPDEACSSSAPTGVIDLPLESSEPSELAAASSQAQRRRRHGDSLRVGKSGNIRAVSGHGKG